MAALAILSLIEELELASGPSKELDALIHASACGRDAFRNSDGRLMARNRKPPHDAYVMIWGDGSVAKGDPPFPSYTASIDAAIPGESIRKVERKRFNNGTIYWIATHDGMGEGLGFVAHAATEPLARRIAALRALLALEDKP